MRKPGSASNTTVWSKLSLPEGITSSIEFEKSIAEVRKAYTGLDGQERRFLNLMYYLLGWMVGDAGKNFHSKRPWARFQLDLSRKHSENLPLGNFVLGCISMLGVPCGRIADGLPRKRDRYGQYRWLSYFSEAFVWLYTAGLGLRDDELTSYDPVRMDWLLTAPREAKIWFLRGVADSDGTVNVRNRSVDIITEPNSAFIIALFGSLGVQTRNWLSKGVGVVSISVQESMKLAIFNPEVKTHRARALQVLAGAQTFQRKWPEWLHAKVNRLLEEGIAVNEIRDRVLWEDNTYVKLKTIKSRLDRIVSQRRELDAGPRAYEAPEPQNGSALPG